MNNKKIKKIAKLNLAIIFLVKNFFEGYKKFDGKYFYYIFD